MPTPSKLCRIKNSKNETNILFCRFNPRNTMNSLPRVSSLPSHLHLSLLVRVNRRAPITRSLHSSSRRAAVAHPVTASGPPPKGPVPSASQYGEQAERKRRQSELLRQGRELRKQDTPKSALKKRFWKDVNVKDVEGACDCISPPTDNKQTRVANS